MKTDIIQITKDPRQIENTLDKIEWIAQYAGMSRRDATSTRLLAEELLTATKNILDAYQGRLWMETDEKTFALHLSVAKPTMKADREKLIALSSDGKATKPKGFFTRLSAAVEKFMLLDDGDVDAEIFADYAMFSDNPHGIGSMYTYHYMPLATLPAQKTPVSKKDELAGIEKSIIDAIVDDILVTVESGTVEIVAVKNLK